MTPLQWLSNWKRELMLKKKLPVGGGNSLQVVANSMK